MVFEGSRDAQTALIRVHMHCAGVICRPNFSMITIRIACYAARENVIEYCMPDWDNLNELQYSREGHYIERFRFAGFFVK